ncbi:MAG: hypothetical protein IKI45_08815 [Oscillospiraceae bacterium]|nr:hypothetical protein [Oscillospiraceae bacterium]
MKKTLQTLMTAAMFSASAVSALSASAQEAALSNAPGEYMAPLYGPPPVDRWIGDMNEDECIDARDLSDLKRMLLNSEGSIDLGEVIDTNHDGKIEVWSWGSNGLVTRQALGDLNQDGVVDKKDVQKMITKLTGKPVKEQTGEETTTTVTEITTTDVITTNTTTCTLYGPPPAWN